jgi:hypothetical protein
VKRVLTLAIGFAIGITGAAFGQPKPETVALQQVVPVVITYGRGGRVDEHRMKFAGYRQSGARVELRGPCYSACTLLTAYVMTDLLCIAEGAFMAFHAVRIRETGKRSDEQTAQVYRSLPPEIQRWIDRNGGWQNLPLDGFWTMYDRRDLWSMGYPKCQ